MRRLISPSALAVACLTMLGLALRLASLGDSLSGDDLSTTWIVTGHRLGEVINRVQTQQEITPPLYFVFAWLAAQAGDASEWLRVPSLVAGTAAIPLVYVLGLRTVGRAAGLAGAALIAVSPILLFYSTEARAHMTALLLVLLSTLALLAALDSSRRRWWAAYAVLSSAAMYTHYTAAFALAGQALWALWAYPKSRRALLVANGIAAAAFLPWLPSLIDDSESPTIAFLGIHDSFDLDTLWSAETLLVIGHGSPFVSRSSFPGGVVITLLALGVGASLVGLIMAARRSADKLALPRRTVLVVVLAVATPVGAALYSLVGDHLFGPRNLLASWPGVALSLGALATAPPTRALRVAAVGLIVAAFSVGAVRALSDDFQRPPYDAVAAFVDRESNPGDQVVDVPFPAGGPRTGLEVALSEPRRVFRLGLPLRPLPVPESLYAPPPEADVVARRAIRRAQGAQLFLVATDPRPAAASDHGPPPGLAQAVVDNLPPGFRLAEARRYEGLADLSVYRYEDSGPDNDAR